MRLTCFLSFLFFHILLTQGQTSLAQIDLPYGAYGVGFRHYTGVDSTRTYSRFNDFTNRAIERPIPISIWYPTVQRVPSDKLVKIEDYMEILKKEEEWEYLLNEQILNWFNYANTPSNQAHMAERTRAYANAPFPKDTFPVVLYAPSFQASSIENFALCEYLASHGYVIIASPSRGTSTRWFSSNLVKEMETQARDVEFLIGEIAGFPMADTEKMGAMGFSFGGLASVIATMRNARIQAVVSLDGSERYQYETLQKSPFFDLERLDRPYIHMAQKDIPIQVLREDGLDPRLNSDFAFYDSLTRSNAHRMKFHHLTHSHFSVLGVLFEKRDPRQDKSDAEIMESYRWLSTYALEFLNANLKDDREAQAFINEAPIVNGIGKGIVMQNRKESEESAFSFQDFNDMASKRDYKGLYELLDSLKKKYPSLELPEGHLNTLGLQLVFNPATSNQGISVFLLAVKLYPKSSNLYDSLAEGYLFINEREKAMESFEKSLELNSENQNARNRLKQLKNE